MFEQLTRNFRLLLEALDGSACPLCLVRGALEQREVERARAKADRGPELCVIHFDARLNSENDLLSEARQMCRMLDALKAGARGCVVCARLEAVERQLALSVRRLDSRIRFHKALEAAPLFCRRHERLIADAAAAESFAETQRAKLVRLRDALARAAASRGDEAKALLARALAYLGQVGSQRPASGGEDDLAQSSEADESPHSDEPTHTGELARAEARTFEAWDRERQLRRLGDVEAEAASLRYRNAVLSEENRRLKLARTALEATCRDLERDRVELLAAKDNSGAGKR